MNKYNRFVLTLAVLAAAVQVALAAAPASYYNAALGKSDEALMTALRNIIHDHREVSYSSGLLNAFAIADVDDNGYIIDIYSNCRYRPSDNGSSASHVGQGYNREHSFPRSWFGGEVAPMNTDVFHIYPTDIYVNSQRGSDPYGVCADGTRLTYGSYVAKGKSGKCTYPGYSGDVFEPDDEYKGDLARTYFYMVTCYKSEIPSWPTGKTAQLDYKNNKYKAFSTWTINMLMEWTRMDPVSDKEIKRNDAVYGIQGNRNPFIDHPELAEYIWGDKQGKAWNGPGDEVSATITAPKNGSTFDMGSTTQGEEISYSIRIKGENLTKGLTLTMSDNENFYASRESFGASEVNDGTTLVITFLASEAGDFENAITLSSSEVATLFTVNATATKSGDEPGPGPIQGDSITEDWEGCDSYASYADKDVQGHAFAWRFTNAGIFTGDNLSIGEYSCRLGKTSSSEIAMSEDYQRGTSGISFWAGCFGSDADATLDIDYSTDHGATWTTLATITATKGSLQHYSLKADVSEPVRYRIAQKTGSRVNIDDITLYARQTKVPGDANNDGEVNILDINYIVNLILEDKTDTAPSSADVDGNGEINITDVSLVISIIFGH